jgi:hypothetical protein
VDTLLFPNQKVRIALLVTISVMVPLVYVLVYVTGGIKYVYSHTMYLPILMMGVFFGWRGGIVVALLGALLLGPFMPLEITTGEPQKALNWIYRAIVFVFIGAFSGFFSDALRTSRQRVIQLLSKHPISNIQLYNALSKDELNRVHEGCLSLIRVLNYQHIIDHLSSNTYYRLWEHIHNELQEHPDLGGELYQMDNHAFLWVSNDHFESSFHQLMDILAISHTIDDVPIYLDVVIGYTSESVPLIAKTQNAYLASRTAEDNHLSSLRYDVQQRNDDISFALVAEVRKAIQDQQFFLEYQPHRWDGSSHPLATPHPWIVAAADVPAHHRTDPIDPRSDQVRVSDRGQGHDGPGGETRSLSDRQPLHHQLVQSSIDPGNHHRHLHPVTTGPSHL